MDAFGETTATCCMPLSYHIHQQQVKVLVHNTGIPPYPTGPNPYHHPSTTPTVTLIPDPPQDAPGGGGDGGSSPRDTKPSPSAIVALVNVSRSADPTAAQRHAEKGQEVTSSSAVEVFSGSGDMAGIAERRRCMVDRPEADPGRTYKPERLDEEEKSSGGGEGEGVRYKTEKRLTPPACPPPECSTYKPHQGEPYVAHKEEKIDVIGDSPEGVPAPCSPEHPCTIAISDAPLPLPPPPTRMPSTVVMPQTDVVTTKVEKRSPDTVSMEMAERCTDAPLVLGELCKVERCPSPSVTDTNHSATTTLTTTTTPTAATEAAPTTPPTAALPLPPPATATGSGEEGGLSRPADKACTPKTKELLGELGAESRAPEETETISVERKSEGNIDPRSKDDEAKPIDAKDQPENMPAARLKGELVGNNTGTGFDCSNKSPTIDCATNGASCVDVDTNGSIELKGQNGDNGKDPIKGNFKETGCNSGNECVQGRENGGGECKEAGMSGPKETNGKAQGNNGEQSKADSGNGKTPKNRKSSSKLKSGQKSKSKTGKSHSSTSKIVNATLKAAKVLSKLSKSKDKSKTAKTKKKIPKADKKKQLDKSKKGKVRKPKTVKKQKGDAKKPKVKKDKLKTKDNKKVKIKTGASTKIKDLKAGASVGKKAVGKQKPKKDDSDCKCKKAEAMSPPKVKVEMCSPSKIKKEREDSVSPKLLPSPKQLRIDTSSPKSSTSRTSSLSPKQKRETSVSPKLRKVESPKPKRETTSPKQKRDETSSSVSSRMSHNPGQQARREDTPSPKIKYRDQIPTNKVLRVHVEALNPKTALSPKLRDSCSPKQQRDSASPRQRSSGEESTSPKSRKEDERKVMLGPRKMVPVKRPATSYSGWHWEGAPYYKQDLSQDSPPVRRKYYKAIRHEDGDVIQVRDCVLVRSGPRKKDIPYVAKIGDFWEDPNAGEMMMNIMWYYRPEQAESDRLPRHVTAELFASKHRDEASIACIDDKCYVLTFNEYCRYKSHQKQLEQGFMLHTKLVPASLDEPPPKRQRIPRLNADPETVFVCRRVYDFKLKRILKNPTSN